MVLLRRMSRLLLRELDDGYCDWLASGATNLVKPEFGIECPDLRRFDKLRMTYADAVQGAVQLFAPEGQKPDQGRKVRRYIVVLPDKALKQTRVIRHPVQDFRRRQSIAGEPPQEIFRNPTTIRVFRHL
jgi:hypothetical protein